MSIVSRGSREGNPLKGEDAPHPVCPLCNHAGRLIERKGRQAVYQCTLCGLLFGETLDSRKADEGQGGRS